MKLICFTLICILGCVSAQSSLGFMSVAGPGTQTPPVDIVTFVEATDADGRTWPASFSVPSMKLDFFVCSALIHFQWIHVPFCWQAI
jgi:hypothetical protein